MTVWVGGAAPSLPENTSLDLRVEMLPDARCHITVILNTTTEGINLGYVPITGGNMDLNVSKTGASEVTIDLEGDVTLTEAGFNSLPQEVTQLNAGAINMFITSAEITGKPLSELLENGFLAGMEISEETINIVPEEIMNIVIDTLSVTEFSWEGRTLRVGLMCVISGELLGNENLGKNLPANLNASLSMSETTLEIMISGNAGQNSMSANATATMSGALTEIHAEIETYFELPVRGDQVEWSPLFSDVGEYVENLPVGPNVNLTVTVPQNASVEGLPSGYTQSGNSYTWSGPEAAAAIGAFLGEGPVSVSYEYVPPSPDILLWTIIGAVVAAAVVSVAAILLHRRK